MLKKLTPLQWSLVVLLLLGSTFLRLRGLYSNGIVGSDTFQYWDITFSWSQGDFVLNNDLKEYRQYFRPTFYALNDLALNVFGPHDYALKELIGIFETINVFLVFCVGWAFFQRGFWSAFALACCYAAIPSTMLLSQIELPHTYSTTFVLGMLLCFTLALRQKEVDPESFPWKWLFAAGLLGGLAATTHGSTTFFGPTMVLLLGLGILWRKEWDLKTRWKKLCAQAATLTGGFAVPYVLGGALVGYAYMVRAIISEKEIRDSAGLNRISLFWKYLTDGPKESISPLMMVLFFVSLIYAAWAFWRKRWSLLQLLPAITVIAFCMLFSLVFQNVFHPRIFLPLNVFVLLIVFTAVLDSLSQFSHRLAPYALMAFAIPVGYLTLKPDFHLISAYSRGEKKGGPRTVYDAIGPRVNAEAKLLVTPYLQYFHRPQYRARVYFDRNALYLIECGQGTLPEYVQKNRVKFILISKDIDKRIMDKPTDFYKNVGACNGMSFETYDLEKDIAMIREFLRSAGATPIPLDSQIGELYELPG